MEGREVGEAGAVGGGLTWDFTSDDFNFLSK